MTKYDSVTLVEILICRQFLFLIEKDVPKDYVSNLNQSKNIINIYCIYLLTSIFTSRFYLVLLVKELYYVLSVYCDLQSLN